MRVVPKYMYLTASNEAPCEMNRYAVTQVSILKINSANSEKIPTADITWHWDSQLFNPHINCNRILNILYVLFNSCTSIHCLTHAKSKILQGDIVELLNATSRSIASNPRHSNIEVINKRR